MTVIVAWKCSDGVVVGADSAATLGSAGISTVKETTSSKLAIVRQSMIVGVSGPVALAQKYEGALNQLNKQQFDGLSNQHSSSVATALSSLFWQHAEPAYQRAQVVAQATQSRAPLQDAAHSTVIALRVQGQDRLFQFSDTCSGEEATDQLPYLSIGSGQQNADPFLAFMRRTFFPNASPSLAGGIFATLWTLQENISSAPGGVGEPIQIAILQEGNARILEPDDLREHEEAIEHAHEALRTFRSELEPD